VKVLIVAEGKHERSGSLETLVRRLMTHEIAVEIDDVDRDLTYLERLRQLTPGIVVEFDDAHRDLPNLARLHRGGFDYFRKALLWVLEAQKRNCDAIILLIDRDRHPARIKGIHEAQERLSPPTILPRALGVAVREFDAWMLADEVALSKVLGRTINCQPSPEGMTDPKSVCEQLRDETPDCEFGLAEMYALVAAKIRLEILEKRCPAGFKPFSERIRALVSPA
jgi:hypothetical protein